MGQSLMFVSGVLERLGQAGAAAPDYFHKKSIAAMNKVHFALTGCIELAQRIPFGNDFKFVEYLDLVQRCNSPFIMSASSLTPLGGTAGNSGHWATRPVRASRSAGVNLRILLTVGGIGCSFASTGNEPMPCFPLLAPCSAVPSDLAALPSAPLTRLRRDLQEKRQGDGGRDQHGEARSRDDEGGWGPP